MKMQKITLITLKGKKAVFSGLVQLGEDDRIVGIEVAFYELPKEYSVEYIKIGENPNEN